MKGAETVEVNVPEPEFVELNLVELEARGGLLPVVKGIVTKGVPVEEPEAVSWMVPGVITGTVPDFADVEKFPSGILYVMLSEGTDADGDGLDAGADEVDRKSEVAGGLCGLPDGGPQSKPML